MNSMPDTPKVFDWTDSFELGFKQMDDSHKEFVQVVNQLLTCADEDFVKAMDEFALHAKEHFGAEDAWMRETQFPAGDCHIDEHAAVMKSFDEVYALAVQGDVKTGRGFAQELMNWFPGHADYLDSALSHWMFKKEHGGKPIVIKRSVGQRS